MSKDSFGWKPPHRYNRTMHIGEALYDALLKMEDRYRNPRDAEIIEMPGDPRREKQAHELQAED